MPILRVFLLGFIISSSFRNRPRAYMPSYAQVVGRRQPKRNITTKIRHKPNEGQVKFNPKRRPRYTLALRRKQNINGGNHFLSKRGRQPWRKKTVTCQTENNITAEQATERERVTKIVNLS